MTKPTAELIAWLRTREEKYRVSGKETNRIHAWAEYEQLADDFKACADRLAEQEAEITRLKGHLQHALVIMSTKPLFQETPPPEMQALMNKLNDILQPTTEK